MVNPENIPQETEEEKVRRLAREKSKGLYESGSYGTDVLNELEKWDLSSPYKNQQVIAEVLERQNFRLSQSKNAAKVLIKRAEGQKVEQKELESAKKEIDRLRKRTDRVVDSMPREFGPIDPVDYDRYQLREWDELRLLGGAFDNNLGRVLDQSLTMKSGVPSNLERTVRNIHLIDSKAVREEGKYQAALIKDTYGNPFDGELIMVMKEWLTPDVLGLAKAMVSDDNFEGMPQLGDALEEAGCTEQKILNHCRQVDAHCRNCWVLDLILGKK